MFTANTIAHNLILAGEGFSWEGIKGSSKPNSKAKTALRVWLADMQDGMCPQCGDALTGSVNFCHVVPRGPLHKGWLPGNVFVGHAACNGYTLGDVDHTMTFEMFAAPEHMFTGEWPSMTALVRGEV